MKRRSRLLCALTALCLLLAVLPPMTASAAAEPWLWPVAGVYEMTRGVGPGHGGIDIKAEFGTPVMASKSGTVIESSNSCPHVSYSRNGGCWCNSGLGNYVKLKHDDGTYSRYLHLKKGTALEVGTHVRQGELIGCSGSSGDSTGPHLHFDAYTADDVRFFSNPTDERHTYHSENGINYVYSVILQPAAPVLEELPQKHQLGIPTTFRWQDAENATDYVLTIWRKNGGSYDTFEAIDGAKSGLKRALPAGSYRVGLRAVNKGTGGNDAVHWKIAEAKTMEFTVADYTPSVPVLRQTQAEIYEGGGLKLVWAPTENTSYYMLSLARMDDTGTFRTLESLRLVSSPLSPDLEPGYYRMQLLAVNNALKNENGEPMWLQSGSNWLLFTVQPRCLGVHEIRETVTQPTCTTGGSTLHVCREDGKRWTDEPTSPLGHAWDWGEMLPAGVIRYTCTRCAAIRTKLITKERSGSCTGGSSCPASAFTDLPAAKNWAHAGIDWAVENGIANGVDAEHFRPQAATTRGQVVTFLWRAAGSPAPSAGQRNPFTDLKPTDYCYAAVLWAVENDIAKGVSDTVFGTKKTCTRGQLVTFLWRWMGCEPAKSSELPFGDLVPGAYYEQAVLWAVEQEITNGDSDTTFSPDKLCTRAQAVTLLRRAAQSED